MESLPVELGEVRRNGPGRDDPRVGFEDLRVVVAVVFERGLESLTEMDRLTRSAAPPPPRRWSRRSPREDRPGEHARRELRDRAETVTGRVPGGPRTPADDLDPVAGPAQEIGVVKNHLDAAEERRVFEKIVDPSGSEPSLTDAPSGARRSINDGVHSGDSKRTASVTITWSWV